jgi:hypothetical protein
MIYMLNCLQKGEIAAPPSAGKRVAEGWLAMTKEHDHGLY